MNSVNYKIVYSKMLLYSWLAIITLGSCSKLVEVPAPTDSVTDANVFSDNSTAIAVMGGLFADFGISTSPYAGSSINISYLAALSGDELTLYSGVFPSRYLNYYRNDLHQNGLINFGAEHWQPLYKAIFKCNAVIEGLNSTQANSLNPAVKNQLMGEAKFLRAFNYFYLINLYGDVALALSTDPKINTALSRSTKEQVYQQIIADLLAAQSLLSDHYLDATLLSNTEERLRPTKWAAAALLARVYLYLGDYSQAEIFAKSVIINTNIYDLTSLNETFLKNSKEAIWQIQPTAPYFNTQDAILFVLRANGPENGGVVRSAYLSPQLLAAFENGDKRRLNGSWVNSVTVGANTYVYPFKYKAFAQNLNITTATGTAFMTEYQMMLRLGEQYLIRAEARAELGNLSGAIADLDMIRNRAGLPLVANTDPGIGKTALLDKILKERQTELFTELGQRWFDLKRTGKIDAVMSVVTLLKSQGLVTWRSYQQWFPLPFSEIQNAPNLRQNTGY
jgi:hypothetical protein